MTPTPPQLAVWAVAALVTAGILIRPFRWPEAVWAVGGALTLPAAGLLPWADGWHAVGKGLDVYLFLTGMLLLSEVARSEGLFDWVAGHAVNHAGGSPKRLFALVYGIGIVVTTFLSNDATAVVLTPAVLAATRRANAEPLPHLLACAFIANAASFVLPISNPANLVLYGSRMPALGAWLASFALPSLLAIAATFAALRVAERSALAGRCGHGDAVSALTAGGRAAATGIAATAVVLTVVSGFDMPLGLPTCCLGAATAAWVLLRKRASPWPLLGGVSWAVLPLVAGLFVVVEALNRSGVVAMLAAALHAAVQASPAVAAAGAGTLLALASNLVNNLPAGLLASTTVAAAQPPKVVVDALLIGVDLGPNLSITGSLATILWLTAIRRDGLDVGFWRFLRVGALVMPPALLLAIGALLLTA